MTRGSHHCTSYSYADRSTLYTVGLSTIEAGTTHIIIPFLSYVLRKMYRYYQEHMSRRRRQGASNYAL